MDILISFIIDNSIQMIDHLLPKCFSCFEIDSCLCS